VPSAPDDTLILTASSTASENPRLNLSRIVAASQPQDRLGNPITVYYNRSGPWDEIIHGRIAGGQKEAGAGNCILYALLPAHGTVLLIAAWPKSEREDLEPEDYKAIGKILVRIQELLDHGMIV
jgi:hypothetical protein